MLPNDTHADTRRTSAQTAFALVMIALGALGLIHGDFAMVWQRIPIDDLPGRTAIAYACATLELFVGIGLLLPRIMAATANVLAVYLLLWLVLLKVPAVIAAPQMEATWLGFGEIGVLLAGVCALRGRLIGGDAFVRGARVLFALCLPMIGLSHFVYSAETAQFVPAWLPFHLACAYLTGAASLVASTALLCGVMPRLAATLEALMLAIITLLVWGTRVVDAPAERLQWTGFVISAAIAAGAWLVAESYDGVAWLQWKATPFGAFPALRTASSARQS